MVKGKGAEESSVIGSLASTRQAGNKKVKSDASVGAGAASVASTKLTTTKEGVALEGWLYKQGSRTKGWHERFFALCGKNISYYDSPDDQKAKVTHVISNEAGCEVGSLFIDERQKGSKKELLYCIKITWSTLEPSNKDSKGDDADDAASVSFGSVTPGTGTPTMTGADVSPLQEEDEVSFVEGTKQKKERRSILKPRRITKKTGESKTPLTSSQKPPRALLARGRTEERVRTPPRPVMSRSKTDGNERSVSDGQLSSSNRKALSHSSSQMSASVQGIGEQDNIDSPPKSRQHRRYQSDGSIFNVADALATPELNTKDSSPFVTPRMVPEQSNRSDGMSLLERNQLIASQREGQLREEQQLMQSLYLEARRENRRKTKKKIANASKVTAAVGAAVTVGVLTAGVGIIAGLVFIGAGAAAGGTSMVAGAGYRFTKKKRGEIVVGTPNYELARQWKDALDACLATDRLQRSTWGQMFALEGRSTVNAVLPTDVGILTCLSRESNEEWTGRRDEKAIQIDPETRWRPMEGGWATMLGTGAHGLRIFREDRQARNPDVRSKLSVKGLPNPPLKGQVVLNASPLDAFMCLMSLPRIPGDGDLRLPLVPNSSQRASFRVIETIDEHMDIIHWIFHPLFLFPTWTAPRDFVVFRYWRLEPDGTYVVCCDSVEHALCPPLAGYTRGEMNGVYTISPRKRSYSGKKSIDTAPECLLSAVVQVDPRGWVPNKPVPLLANQGYGEAFAVSALLQMLDIRDAVDHDRFVPIASEIHGPRTKPLPKPDDFGLSPFRGRPGSAGEQLMLSRSASMESLVEEEDYVNYDFSYAMKEKHLTESQLKSMKAFASSPPQLETEFWAEPDANSFRVRGKTYTKDKKKINAGRSIGRLIATDVVVVEKTQYGGMCNHPTQRVQKALERERQGLESGLPPFLFVVNICLPGPPFFHGVFYYAIDDMSTIDGTDGTPSSKLCNEFIFGDSDKFRNETFKLIPQIVEGNFIVRKAVGSTPAIMGTKLTQTYARGDRFFEVILDCGSSSVATGVIRVSLGYCTEMVIDMGFLLEGKDESVLPERIFGGARIKKLHFDPARLRFMKEPEDCTPDD